MEKMQPMEEADPIALKTVRLTILVPLALLVETFEIVVVLPAAGSRFWNTLHQTTAETPLAVSSVR